MLASQAGYADQVEAERNRFLARIAALVMLAIAIGAWYWVAEHRPAFDIVFVAGMTAIVALLCLVAVLRFADWPHEVAVTDLDDRPGVAQIAVSALILTFATAAIVASMAAAGFGYAGAGSVTLFGWVTLFNSICTRFKGIALFHEFRGRQGLTLNLGVSDPDARPKKYDISIKITGINTSDCAWLVKRALGNFVLLYDGTSVRTTSVDVPAAELVKRVAALRLQGIRIDGARGAPERLFSDGAVLSARVA